MTPPTEWPIGVQYATVTTVTHSSPLGIHDPSITDRICLHDEAPALIRQVMERNPYATAYVSQVKTWRGMYTNER